MRQQHELRPPGRSSGADRNAASALLWVWGALGALLVVGLAVVLLLPNYVARQDQPVTMIEPQPADAQEARTSAETILRDYLSARARLEVMGVEQWQQPEWDAAAAQAQAGDRLFGERRFADAAAAYQAGLDQLLVLESSREQWLALALQNGVQSLNKNEIETAGRFFQQALNFDPANADAASGLQRARVREQVLQHMARGQVAEAGQDWAGALTAYDSALQLDDAYAGAVEARQRVAALHEDTLFTAAVNDALAAIDVGRYAQATKALDRASTLRPDDAVVADLRRRLATGRQQASLDRLRREATGQVRAEDWVAASATYQKALKIDPVAAFARQGIERARNRARLHEQIEYYLGDVERLYSPDPLANAGALLASSAQVPVDEPALAGKVAALRQAVDKASTPLPVTLRSDDQTEVTVYRVGRLGRFSKHSLSLRPGTYTVVGSRTGYRDVRATLSVTPGVPVPSLLIVCREPI